MHGNRAVVALVVGSWGALAGTTFAQGWVTFVEETSSRLSATSNLALTDPEEKDYAWGDLDNDGDIDLVVVRKQGFTTPGGRRNVLLMNEGGVLTDRTIEFATEASDTGQGFLDLTNDRDVFVADLNNDGWLDVVTATALNQSMPKTISHPRVYMNLGNDPEGYWLGLYYDEPRFPQLSVAPNTCGLAVGDLTGDGFADIYIVDYLSNLEDRLLVNDGTAHFTDQTTSRLTPAMTESGFGTQGAIIDMNGDAVNDIVKSEAGAVRITLNDPTNPGFFNKHEVASSGSHYNMSVGELNGDGHPDIIISDDGSDRYLIETSIGADGFPNWLNKTYSFQGGGDDGIGGNSEIVDLNNDGFNDVLTADVDVDIPGCSRRLHFYRNLGNTPNVTLQDQGTAGIPVGKLTGTHDIAVFDINGDGWKDLVIGRCNSTSIWINQPPVGIAFTYPSGLPGYVLPGFETSFTAHLAPIGAVTVEPGSETVSWSIAGGAWQTAPVQPLGNGDYDVVLPAVACTGTVKFYLNAELTNGTPFHDPSNAPLSTYSAIATIGTEIVFTDSIEADVSGWTVTNDPTLTGGGWVAEDPLGTAAAGQVAQPENDATSGDGVKCWITANGVAGGAANASDVDGGPSVLLAPPIDLANADATVRYARWVFCDDDGTGDEDKLAVEVSNDDGDTWVLVEKAADTGGVWANLTFKVSDFVEPTGFVRVRFSISDLGNNSVTEAGVDDFTVEKILCSASCPGDLDGSGAVDGGDLGMLLAAWGGAGPADLDLSGAVDGADLGALLAAWGGCG